MNDSALQRIDPEDEQRGELVTYQAPPPPSLFGTADPVEVVARASRVAASLKEVVKKQGLISKISGKEYPRCEAWTLLGTMLGVFPVLVWSRPVEGGWEARVEARTRDGAIVGAAEAQCLKTERNWSNRDDFALRSMAQTRATAKALRMPLGFVMTLGGFQATPAEEMDFDHSQPAQRQQPANDPHGTKAKPAPVASEDQRQRWIGELKLRGEYALGYCHDKAWLLPPSGDFPGEPLETLDARHVPTTRKSADAILAELDSLMPENQRPKPAGASKPPSTSAGQASGASESQQEAGTPLQSDSDDSTQYDENGDPVETIVGKLEAVSEKSGSSKKGPWTRYGLKIGELWISTFSKPLGDLAKQDRGHSVRVQYRRTDKGCDLISIERAR